MESVRVRYPGRICLLGDHCDWAGGSSLTVPTPMGIEVRADRARDGILVRSDMNGETLEQRFPIEKRPIATGPLRFIPAILNELLCAGIPVVPAELWVRSDLPAGRGLSSSASFSLGVIDALCRLSGQPLTIEQLMEAAFSVEHDQLGVGCGRLDQAACAAAEPLLLRWNGHETALTTRLAPFGTVHLVVVVMNAPRNTAMILRTLQRHHAAPIGDPHGDAVREALSEFGTAAERGARALQTGDLETLGAAMNSAQHLYDCNLAARFPDLDAPAVRRAIAALRGLGSLGAKFSGAGGEGSVVGLFKDENTARSAAVCLESDLVSTWYTPLKVA